MSINTKKEAENLFEKIFGNDNDLDIKVSPLKNFIKMYRSHVGKIIVSLFFYIIKSSPIWILPLITANIINIISDPTNNSLDRLWINFAIIIIVLAQNIPFNALYIKYASKAIRYVEAGLRGALVRKLQQLSILHYNELKVGKIQSKLLRDVEAIEFLSRQIITSLIPGIISAIITVYIVIVKSRVVALFFLMIIPVIVIVVNFFRKNIRRSNKKFRRTIEDMSAKVSEMIEMIPITRAHGLEDVEIDQVDTKLEKVQRRGLKMDMLNAYFGASSWVVFQLFQATCLVFTGYLAYQGEVPVGDVVMYQGLFASIVGHVSLITNIYPNIAKGFESINSISEILLINNTEDNRGKHSLKDVSGHFKFQDVKFSYESTEGAAVKNFNLDVSAGETIAFVGESGAGKSTILNLIIGFNLPTEGKILIDGIDMNNLDLRSYRNFLAVVPQNNILFSSSIRENIIYGLPSVNEKELQRIIELANLKEFIDQLPQGLDTLVGEHGGRLSGGQKQRIAIARALIRDPKIIVLDEATSALDNISEYHVQQAMNRLIEDRTTFIVAHRLSTIRDADRIVVMKDGKSVEVGSYDKLIEHQGEFYRLQQLQK